MEVVQLLEYTSKHYFEPYPDPKTAHIRAPKSSKNDPEIKSKSNVRIEGAIENKICSHW